MHEGCQKYLAQAAASEAAGHINLHKITREVPTVPVVAGCSTTVPPTNAIAGVAGSSTTTWPVPTIGGATGSTKTMGPPGPPLGPDVVRESQRRLGNLETEVEELRNLAKLLKDQLELTERKVEQLEWKLRGWTDYEQEEED